MTFLTDMNDFLVLWKSNDLCAFFKVSHFVCDGPRTRSCARVQHPVVVGAVGFAVCSCLPAAGCGCWFLLSFGVVWCFVVAVDFSSRFTWLSLTAEREDRLRFVELAKLRGILRQAAVILPRVCMRVYPGS